MPDTEGTIDPEPLSASGLTGELVRRGERLKGTFTPGPDQLGDGPLASAFTGAAASACDLYRITLSLWDQDTARRPESSRGTFLHELALADRLISLAARSDLARPDSYRYGLRVWEAFQQTSVNSARLLAELAVTHDPAPAPGPEAGARMLPMGWAAATEPLRALKPATVPTDRATLEAIALRVARRYEAWMEQLGFLLEATAENELDFMAVDSARWTPTLLPEPSDDPPSAEVPLDWFGETRPIAEELAQRDGRFDPRFIDRSVRRMLRAWLAAGRGEPALLASVASESILADAEAPTAEDFDSRVPLHEVHLCGATVVLVYPNASFPTSDPELHVVVSGEAADERPAPVVSGLLPGPLRFVIQCTVKPDADDEGAWRLCTARVVTEDGRNRTPYVVRRETADEHRARAGLATDAQVTPAARVRPPYRYLVSCHYWDDSLRTGGSVEVEVSRDTVPTRAEAELLLARPAFDALCAKANTDYGEPSLDRFETRELLEALS